MVNSWEGNSTESGPDFFYVMMGGSTMVATTFSNGCGVAGQSYPDPYFTSNPARTGEDPVLSGRFFGTGCDGDAAYHIELLLGNADSAIAISFQGSNLQGWPDEGWGIDNVSVTLGGVPPDFVVSALGDPPASAVTGETGIRIPQTTMNVGEPAANEIRTGVFLSLDNTFGAGDFRAGGIGVPALAKDEEFSRPVKLKIPPMPSGDYYLVACADPRDQVFEIDESNNCRSSTTTVHISGPDLVVSSLSEPPATAARGSEVAMEEVTFNSGATAAAASTTFLYLTASPSLRTGALLGSFVVGQLEPGTGDDQSASLTVPDVAPGLYYVVACADAARVVPETNERNNCTSSTGTIDIT